MTVTMTMIVKKNKIQCPSLSKEIKVRVVENLTKQISNTLLPLVRFSATQILLMDQFSIVLALPEEFLEIALLC